MSARDGGGARRPWNRPSRPPIQLVVIGSGDAEVKIGNETQLFRHEEKFHRPAAVAVRISDTLDEAAIAQRAAAIGKLAFERIGQQIRVNLVAVENVSGYADTFEKAARLAAEKSGLACVLIVSQGQTISAGGWRFGRPTAAVVHLRPRPGRGSRAGRQGPRLPAGGPRRRSGRAGRSDAAKINALGVEQIVLDPGHRGPKPTLEALTKIRRLSLKNFRPLGYPAMAFTTDADPTCRRSRRARYVAKYAGVVVTDAVEPWQMLPVLTTRQDIYTDPQKPVAVEPKLYAVGEVGPESPLLVTTNFSLSYYSVEGEVEASRVPAYILAVDTEGHFRADRLGLRQVQCRDDHQGVEEGGNRRQVDAPDAGHCPVLWPCSRPASKTSPAGPSRLVRKRRRASAELSEETVETELITDMAAFASASCRTGERPRSTTATRCWRPRRRPTSTRAGSAGAKESAASAG